MLESEFWPKADVDTAVQSFLPNLEGINALAAYIRVGNSVLEMEEPSGYKTPGNVLQVTVFLQDRTSGEDPSLVAIRELKKDKSLWEGTERLVFVRPITLPFRKDIQTLEQAVREFIEPDKDHQIYPLVHST